MDMMTLGAAKKMVEETMQDVSALKGADGLSAYQIAVNNGFSGTETEWLNSLKGEKGEVGPQGPQGEAAANFEVDDTLRVPGKAADAAATGAKLSQLSGEIEDLKGSGTGATTEQLAQIEQNKNDISNLSSAVAVERERINQFTKLEDGSTSGDAELIDARVDYKGTTHANVGEHLRYIGSENKTFIEEVDKQVILSTNVDVVPFRNSSLGNGKVYSAESESFYFFCIKGHTYKWTSDGNRQDVGFFFEIPTVGKPTYNSKIYSYARKVEFVAPITGYCMVYHNNGVSDDVAESVIVTTKNNIDEFRTKNGETNEFIDELYGQLSNGTVLTTRLSGYNFVYNKITANNSESFYFKVFKDVAYKYNDAGTRQNVIFTKEKPQEGVVAYDNTTHSYPRGVEFIAPITGYCVIHHNHTIDDNVAQSVEVNVTKTLVDQCEDNVLDILESNDLRTLPSIYLEEIERVKDIVTNQDFGLSFLFATDIHIRDEAHLYKMDIMGKCGDLVDLIVLNGDIVDGSEAEDVSYVKKLLKESVDRTRNPVSNTYALAGNHDNNFLKVNLTKDSSNAITNRMFTNLTCKGETNAVYDSKHPMQVYYYIDFPQYKIRMICLNVCLAFEDDGSRENHENVWGFTTDEMYWMRDTALRFDDKEDSEEWGVVLCSHISILRDENVEYHTPKSITFTGMMNAFKNGSSYTEPDTAIGFGTDNVFDFSDQGGREVICYLAGHLHYDLVSTANDLQIPVISTTSGHASQSTLCETQTPETPITTPSAPVRTDDRKNVNSECFDLVKIDRQKRKIICTRYGAGNSREIEY